MWGQKSRRIKELEARCELLAEELSDVRDERRDFKESAALLARRNIEADSANRRLTGRNDELTRRLDVAQRAVGIDTKYAHELETRLARALKACARYRQQLAARPALPPPGLVSALHRSEKARGALDEQCRELQKTNEVQAKKLREHAERNTA